ncbi:MAG: hypothetical protein DI523_25085 [Paraburkholderia fungorum]|nr:MAG: hypothetical protein DI523_25085 [Paraburkholderia fungorum]
MGMAYSHALAQAGAYRYRARTRGRLAAVLPGIRPMRSAFAPANPIRDDRCCTESMHHSM